MFDPRVRLVFVIAAIQAGKTSVREIGLCHIIADMLGVSKRSLENWEQERAMPQGFGLKAMLKLIEGKKAESKPQPRKKRK